MSSPAATSPARPGVADGDLGSETLYTVIGALANGPDLDRVLPAVVEMLSQATGCHACFIYLLEGDTLRMRAASQIYAHLVGKIAMSIDEGLCGWVARHGMPAFIRDHATADPRMKLFPELDEEHFQSMIAVPLRRGEGTTGVVVLHTEAPREFGTEIVDFLVHVAALVSGAINNARLYGQTRRQVERLTALTALGQRLSASTRRADLYRLGCEGPLELLDATHCRLILLDGDANVLDVVAEAGTSPPEPVPLLPSSGDRDTLTVRLGAGDEELGALVVSRAEAPFDDEEARLLDTLANQLALALQKVELIDRLTGESIASDFFAALEANRLSAATSRAVAAGVDVERTAVVVVLRPTGAGSGSFAAAAERAGGRLRRAIPGALLDIGATSVRGLLPAPVADAHALARIDREVEQIAVQERVAAGRSAPRVGLIEARRSLIEAAHAARVVAALRPEGGSAEYGGLGAYRYLERTPDDPAPDERHAVAIATLFEYDRRRDGRLIETLERYLEERGSVAATAEGLFVHANTLRQRLRRIESLTDLELAGEDLLSLELAIKLAVLRGATWPLTAHGEAGASIDDAQP